MEDKHVYVDGCADKCGQCNLCCLSICEVCGGAEGSMPTHCPGENTSMDKLDAVYAGTLDFRAGKWREGISNRAMSRNPDDAIANEKKYLDQLIEEGADKEYIDEAFREIEKWREVQLAWAKGR